MRVLRLKFYCHCRLICPRCVRTAPRTQDKERSGQRQTPCGWVHFQDSSPHHQIISRPFLTKIYWTLLMKMAAVLGRFQWRASRLWWTIYHTPTRCPPTGNSGIAKRSQSMWGQMKTARQSTTGHSIRPQQRWQPNCKRCAETSPPGNFYANHLAIPPDFIKTCMYY